MTPEGKVKAKVKKILSERKYYYVMPVTNGYGNSGAPDFIICAKGHFIGIECKANGGKTTALQEKHLFDIQRSGGTSFVIDEESIDNLKELLDNIKVTNLE